MNVINIEHISKIYGEKTYDHIVNWRDNSYRETECGPFKINLAYLQGELKSSRVDVENYARIKAKQAYT